MEKRNALLGAVHHRNASLRLQDSSLNGKTQAHTFVIVSDDNGGERYDWVSGESYIEELEITGASLTRLKTFFKDHVRSTDSAVGRIENARVDGGTILADVVYGSGQSEQDIKRKYDEGILTDVSIGYEINNYEVDENPNGLDVVRVTSYDIFELSAVGIGFDQGANKRGVTMGDEKDIEARVSKLEAQFGISIQGE